VLAREAELLFDLDLDGKAVAVPAAFARDMLPAHGVEPGIDVLEQPRPHMVDAGAAVGCGGSFVEDPLRCAVPAAEGLPENVVVTPAGEDPFLE
jgi:hypothetical protein